MGKLSGLCELVMAVTAIMGKLVTLDESVILGEWVHG